MNKLARHIELLLHENDCVILPGFGGFIAHDVPAYYVSEEGLYYPPTRSISFNASITMNDGLLAQSYMKSHHVDYARATYLIDMAIEQLRDTLDEEGQVTLSHIGTIKQDIHQSLLFTPESTDISSAINFGLGSFTIKELCQLTQHSYDTNTTQPIITQTEKTINVHINKSILRQVMSTAAIVLLLLMISIPTGNHKPTDIASLHLTEMLHTPITPNNISVNQQQVVNEQLEQKNAIQPTETKLLESDMITIPYEDIAIIKDIPIVAAKECTTSPTLGQEDIARQVEPSKEFITNPTSYTTEQVQCTAVSSTKTYHIIIASLPNHRGAEETLNSYLNKGYTQASIVERDNRVRISLVHFSNKDEANDYLKTLRENEQFQNAWLLAVRN